MVEESLGVNMYRTDDSVVVFGAGVGASIGGNFTTADLRVLAMYVGSMKKHAKVMRKAKAVANGLPGIVIGGNNGSNNARATHLLAQLERFFEHYNGGGASFEPE